MSDERPADGGALTSDAAAGAGRPGDRGGDDERADAESRVFPCERCGADLTFSIGAGSLECSHCGFVKRIETDAGAAVEEQDFRAMLARVVELRAREDRADDTAGSAVTCEACGACVRFTGTLTSSECAYCGSPLQLDHVHDAPQRIRTDGVLPFLLEREGARVNLARWVRSRWFAPNDFKARGIGGRFNGVYLPYWTFDALTTNRYLGQRGEHYWVTVGSGKNRRQVMRTRWYPVSGMFQRFFDDVLVVAATGLPTKRLTALEPWPLKECVPFRQELLAGFLARTYDVELDDGFIAARDRMAVEVEADVRARIGGDVQRVQSITTRHEAITYKHLLLPVWMLAYRYGEKSYQVVVNAGTGEVQGDRPYSWIKIALAVAAAAVIGAVAWFLSQAG